VPKPYKTARDIFCFRITRTADAYRKISIENIKFKVNKANPRDELNLRIYPVSKLYSEIRFWREVELLDIQKIKNEDLKRIIH
jgi:hypothetical protein